MANANVARRINSKIETRNAIIRLTNGSFKILNKEKLNQKFIARIRRERHNLLDKRRDIAEAEIRKIAADILQDEVVPTTPVKITTLDDYFSIDQELLLEEELHRESLQEYEDWLQNEIDSLLSLEDPTEDTPLVCPVCCRHCFEFGPSTIECGQCQVPYPLTKTINSLRDEINANLADHNCQCAYHPQFANVPDGGGRNTLLILCHSCSFLNILL